MEKITIQFEPALNDYSTVARSFLTRKRSYWVALGVYSMCTLILCVLAVIGLFDDSFRFGLYLAPVFLLLLILVSYPLWSGWLTIKSAPKKEQLTLPATYELDDEKVMMSNAVGEGKFDWSVFSKVVDDGQYFFLSHSTNKNMFHFIPKRAFASAEHEKMTRDLLIRHLGEIEETQKGLTGWKLALLAAFLFFMLMVCVSAVVILAAILI